MTDPTTPQPVEQPQPPVQYIVVHRPTDPWSVVALVFGILSAAGGWCCFGAPGFVALAAGGISLITNDDEAKSGKGMAIAGLILGALTGIPWLILGASGVLGSAFNK